MKTFAVVSLFLSSFTVFAASVPPQAELRTIECVSEHGDKATFTPLAPSELGRLKDGHGLYRVVVDEALSSGYIGEITAEEGRLVNFNKGTLEDWDGNSGVYLDLPAGVVQNSPRFEGRNFEAKLTVTYHDVSDDEVENDVTCRRL